MKRIFLTALCIASLFAVAAAFAPNAIALDNSLPGQNHYILCDKGAGCSQGIGGAVSAAAYRIESVYSNLSGWFQYIELRENSADGKVTPLAGAVITVRHGDVIKQFVIPSDPPAGFPAGGALIITTIDDWSDDSWNAVSTRPPDYVMPERLVPTDGGTIDLNGQDPWTFNALPTDGSTMLLRSGDTAPAGGQSFALGRFWVHIEYDGAREYYNAARDHYFVTASEPDIDAIESGRTKGWQETAFGLGVLTVPRATYCCSMYGQVAVPVCRYYIPPESGDSHFFSASAQECAEVAAKFPSFVRETDEAFFVIAADKDTGVCPVPFRPVYRLWNQRADTNHRYIVDDLARRMDMMQKGWVPEGYGPTGVAWCQ